METIKYFNINRLYLLTRRQILSNAYGWLIAFGAVAGSLLVISLLVAISRTSELTSLDGLYLSVMFIGGYVFTSNIFAELHQSQRSYQFLTLPVSATERLVSAWLITAVFFPVIALLGMAIIVLLANLIASFTFNITPFQQVFSEANFLAIKVYFVTQSVFLLGATYFRKNNFLKTLLALFVALVIYQLIIALAGWALFYPLVDGPRMQFGSGAINTEMETLFLNRIPGVVSFIFWYLTVPFFLVTTWFSLKERQV